MIEITEKLKKNQTKKNKKVKMSINIAKLVAIRKNYDEMAMEVKNKYKNSHRVRN